MERHSLRALLSVAVLIPLAWLGIALVGKLHGSGGHEVLLVVWAVAMAALLGNAIWSVAEARRARLERRPEDTRAR